MPMPRCSGGTCNPGLRDDAIRQQDLAALHGLEAREAAQHRGLAAAGGSEQAADASGLQHEVHAADDAMLAIGMLQRTDADGSGHRARLARHPRAERRRLLRGEAGGPALAQRLDLRGHLVADEHLRLRRRRVTGVALALGHERLRLLERRFERVALREPLVEERVAEERGRRPAAAAERRAVLPRIGDDHRVLVLQRRDEAARIARRDDDDAPLDLRVVQQLLQPGGRELDERQRRLLGKEPVVGRAAAGEIDHHDIVLGVDDRTDLVQRLAEVGHRRERHGQQRLRIVDQHHRASVRAPAAVHRRLRGLRIARDTRRSGRRARSRRSRGRSARDARPRGSPARG